MSEFQRLLHRKPRRRSRRRLPPNLFLPLILAVAAFLAVAGSDQITGGLRASETPLGGYSAGSRTAPASRPGAGAGRQLIDRVTRIRDGDTIVVGLIPIRIANLDCAESGTRAGERATRRMRELVTGQTLTCRLEGRKSYDREVGVCALNGRDIGETMIAGGYCERWRWR